MLSLVHSPRPRPAVPPTRPPLLLSLALGATLVFGGWFAVRVVQVTRVVDGYSMEAREALATAALPAWPELRRLYERENPPESQSVPTGDPAPVLDAMLQRTAVKSVFHLAPDMTLTYRARGATALHRVDLKRWRPLTLGLGPHVGADGATHQEETLIAALTQENALPTAPGWFIRVPVTGIPHRIHIRGAAKTGWIGYDTAVAGDAATDILVRLGLADLASWSFQLPPRKADALFLRTLAIVPTYGTLPPPLADVALLPLGENFHARSIDTLLAGFREIAVLLLFAVLAGVGSLRQLKHVMRHQAIAAARGRFVSGMSHEMRTPLTTIKLYTEMLQHGVVTEPAARTGYLATIARECDRLARMVDNVLAYAALESRGRPLFIQPVDAREALEEAIAAAEAPLALAGLTVTLHVPVPLRLAADRDALVLALTNLLTNAAKYAAEGREVIVTALPDGQHDALITVRDFGPGVPASDALRIFEPFYRRPHASAPGTGLGLALVQETAKNHGGHVVVESAPGEGAEFRLRLPLAIEEATA